MIAHTVEQAAARVFTTVDVIEQWIADGHLHAVRNPIDRQRYIEEDHLLEVDRALRVGDPTTPRPEPIPAAQLARWLADHGRPTTDRALRDWIETGRLTPTVRSRPGPRGWPARYDPLDALALARALDAARRTSR